MNHYLSYLKLPKTLLCFASLIFFLSCSSNDEKDWDDYVREAEKEETKRIEDLEQQIGDSLTQIEISDLKQKESEKISLIEVDFVNSVKAFDRENNENRYGELKAICSTKKCTFFDMYIELTEKYKLAELQSRIKAMQTGYREDHFYEFIGKIKDGFEIEFCNKYGLSRDLFTSFRNNYASCYGDNQTSYCSERKPQLPNAEYWGF